MKRGRESSKTTAWIVDWESALTKAAAEEDSMENIRTAVEDMRRLSLDPREVPSRRNVKKKPSRIGKQAADG